jgi:hypothetical protein
MRNNNKLTLKALQQELEALKAKSASKPSSRRVYLLRFYPPLLVNLSQNKGDNIKNTN